MKNERRNGMKVLVGISALALLLFGVAPVSAAVIGGVDGLNTDSPYVAADPDIEGEFNAHDAWTDSTSFKVLQPEAQVPTGWRFAQQDWNGENGYMVLPDTALKSEGDASMMIVHMNTLIHQDIFVGVWIDGLTPAQQYDISFDFQADAGQVGYNGYPVGSQTGDDYHWSASWQVADVADSPQGWGATEDYPGHETGSIWIQPADWDGAFHTQTGSFVATNTSMAFVLKYRAMGANGQYAIRLDNLVVPEPASLLLLSLGGLFCLRRRR
jgi:hypothetical protein